MAYDPSEDRDKQGKWTKGGVRAQDLSGQKGGFQKPLLDKPPQHTYDVHIATLGVSLQGISSESEHLIRTTLKDLTDRTGVKFTTVQTNDKMRPGNGANSQPIAEIPPGGRVPVMQKGKRNMFLNPQWFKTPDSVLSESKKHSGRSNFLAVPTIPGIITHEFAHFLDTHLSATDRNLVNNTFNGADKGEIGSTISSYAAQASSEFYAESFSKYHNQGPDSLKGTPAEPLIPLLRKALRE